MYFSLLEFIKSLVVVFGWHNLREIHLLGKIEILWSEITCLDEKMKRKFKLKNFEKMFQINKIIKFEIRSKEKIEIL